MKRWEHPLSVFVCLYATYHIALVLCHVSTSRYAHGDCLAFITLADAVGGKIALRGCHLGHAAGDGATRSIHIAVADAGTSATARGRDGAAGDGDIAAGALIAAADAGTASVVLNIMTESAERAGRCAVRSAETLGAVWQLISKAPTAIHIVNFILL